MNNLSSHRFVFFGGEPLAIPTLDILFTHNIVPSLVVCNPDRPAGRGNIMTPPPTKVWADAHHIPVFQPTTYKDGIALEELSKQEWDLFIVVAYNFILPSWLLELPKHGVINVHPSLLPKLRGASPIRTAILENQPEHIGVTVILMDEAMDHGPILAQTTFTPDTTDWPMNGPDLDKTLAMLGGTLLAQTIPKWLTSIITPIEQNHLEATYCGKLKKEHSELTLNPHTLPTGKEALEMLLKIRGYAGVFDTFFMWNNERIKIKKAELTGLDGQLRLLRVIPAGKKEMDFSQYLQSLPTLSTDSLAP